MLKHVKFYKKVKDFVKVLIIIFLITDRKCFVTLNFYSYRKLKTERKPFFNTKSKPYFLISFKKVTKIRFSITNFDK